MVLVHSILKRGGSSYLLDLDILGCEARPLKCQYLDSERPVYLIAKEMTYNDNKVTGLVHKYGQIVEIA